MCSFHLHNPAAYCSFCRDASILALFLATMSAAAVVEVSVIGGFGQGGDDD